MDIEDQFCISVSPLEDGVHINFSEGGSATLTYADAKWLNEALNDYLETTEQEEVK